AALRALAPVGCDRDLPRGGRPPAGAVPPRARALRRRGRRDPRRRAGAGGAREDSAPGGRRLRGHGPDAGARMMELTFWGVRGSIPAPGPGTVRYGGNTSCVSLRTSEGKLIVLDCGTGARNLGMSLLDGPFGRGKGQASILLSHAHWDHIQGFPFFVPLYIAGNTFSIFG